MGSQTPVHTVSDFKKLLDRVEYCDGLLIYTKGCNKGKPAGSVNSKGYVMCKSGRTRVMAHRAIFLLHHGYLPAEIDHINRDRSDNRIENLREVTSLENNMNRELVNTSTGFVGVNVHGNYYRMNLTRNGKYIQVGKFETPELASEFRDLLVSLI